ncbi:hypothetical protein M440DRAFT_1440869 [Trichoderma longibrachiatum ATCC 18648]|uniref:Uncharacterized protein n=1 Tax=Trichoderma longibrachiatum ATCC 18648 TaxID=983965 RepID=A0A2T4BXH0_TRILO|nr:hypothetical protein M440DRAFT_1440869 [Trichoderma longibrachiatum ATCC 18648]
MSHYDKASKTFMELGRLFPRRTDYQIHCSSSAHLQRALCSFYASFLRYCKRAVQSSQQQWLSPSTGSSSSSLDQELQRHVVEMELHSRDVTKAIVVAEAKAHHQDRQLQTMKQKKPSRLKRMLSKENDKSTLIGDLQSEVDRRRAMERRQQLLDFLSTHDYRRSDTFVSFFFIQFDDQRSMNAETILKSIIQQALHASSPSREIEFLLERMRLSLSSGLQDLLELLRKTVASFETFYIAIDGIDECSKQDRGELFKALSSLLATESNTKLFLAGRDSVSRELRNAFTAADNQITMACPSVQTDIATYVEGIVQDKLQSEDLIVEDLSLIEEIKIALTEGADGMFLWVSFQIDELTLQRCDGDIRRAIHNLPKDLQETFNRVLDRIISGRNEHIAKQVFRWVATAKEPLSLDQLSEVIFIEIGQPYLKPERRSNGLKHISSWCENLVQVDEELQTVQFVHQSVQQFLLSKSHGARHNQFSIEIEDVDHYVGEICVTYLNLNDFKKALARRQQPLPPMPPIAMAGTALRPHWKVAASFSSLWKFNLDTRGGSEAATAVEATARGDDAGDPRASIEAGHPFLTYAAIHWISHTTRFERDKSKTWSLWVQMIRDGHDLAKKPWDEGQPDQSNTAVLKWSCKYGHYAVVRLLVRDSIMTADDKNQVLLEATRHGDITLLDIVLETKSSALQIDHACQLAIEGNQLDILPRLVTAGADYLSAIPQKSSVGIVLHLGIGKGQIEMNGRTALQAAAERGHSDIAKLLLDAGTNVDAADVDAEHYCGDGNSLLEAAVTRKHMRVVSRLLASGATRYPKERLGGWN